MENFENKRETENHPSSSWLLGTVQGLCPHHISLLLKSHGGGKGYVYANLPETA